MGHVLVIDDDADVRTLVCGGLEGAGCRVHAASSGLLGLAMAASHVYDALVVDQRLPDLAGLELLRQLREVGVHVPVVFITGYGADQFREAAAALGAVECLDKPIRLSRIASAVIGAMAWSPSWPRGAPLFARGDGTPALQVARLARTLAAVPATWTLAEALHHLARAIVDPHVSRPEFVVLSRAFKRLARSADQTIAPSFLATLAADLRSKTPPAPLAEPPLPAFLSLLDGDPTVCHLATAVLAERLGARLTDLERACAPLGITPAACRHAYLMRHVLRLLIETQDEHIKQITYQAGFEHPSNLTRAFRAQFGVTPREFRALLAMPETD